MLRLTNYFGVIVGIEDYGSIVTVIVNVDGREVPVHFDHRCFTHLLESEQCEPIGLIGREATFSGTTMRIE